MTLTQAKNTRRRGVVLTPAGLKRLQEAIAAVEKVENRTHHLTLEQLSKRTSLSAKTWSRLCSLNSRMDQKTLNLCFNAFNIELYPEDYIAVDETVVFGAYKETNWSAFPFTSTNLFLKKHLEQGQQLENISYPNGPIPLDSPFYLERPPLEQLVCQEIIQPGCLIQIRSPRQMGKNSLMLRMFAFAQQQEYRTVNINCYQIDTDCFTDLNKLLRCLCWRIAIELGINPNLNHNWDEELGSKFSSSLYFQKYLLNQCQSPVVLILNEVDCFFDYPHICQEFLTLLRCWSEEARSNSDWQKLRVVLVYSTEKCISLDSNCSLFNIGLPVNLGEFTQAQVKDLARRYGLDWCNGDESAELMSLVGGHPALIQITFYYLCCQKATLQELIHDASANGGIYRDHLWGYWMKLQENPSLARSYAEVVTAKESIYLNSIHAYHLDSLGLIRFEGDRVLPRFQLYRTYFTKQLSATTV
jgi:AAA-like domain